MVGDTSEHVCEPSSTASTRSPTLLTFSTASLTTQPAKLPSYCRGIGNLLISAAPPPKPAPSPSAYQRHARHRADDACGPVPSGARQDAAEPGAAVAIDRPQAAASEVARPRSRAARHTEELRSSGKNFGLRVGVVGKGGLRQRVRELIEGRETLTAVMSALREAHQALQTQYNILHKRLLNLMRDDPLCRRLMTAPGIEPVIALTFQATVDGPTRLAKSRLAKSRLVGAHFGLTPKRYASGETDHNGRVSKCGDAMMRTALFEGAQALLVCTRKWCSLKAWGMAIAHRRGTKRAIAVAQARGDPAPHVAGWHGIPLGQRGSDRSVIEPARKARNEIRLSGRSGVPQRRRVRRVRCGR